ncbi:Ribosome-recycling factor [Buchnera aphidicola (Thelaxes suberi)]
MIKNSIENTKKKMEQSLLAFKNRINSIRTNRVKPEILNNIYIEYYGKKTSLCQVANIVLSDPRTLKINSFDTSYNIFIQKSILSANLGFTPSIRGNSVYVSVPFLTEENRKKIVKNVKKEAEQARIEVRNIRRENNDIAKMALKEKILSKDEEKKIQHEIQKITNLYIDKIDKILIKKESDIMQI